MVQIFQCEKGRNKGHQNSKYREIKVSKCADDTTMILDRTEESLRASLSTMETFGNISGLKLNREKTEALWIGSKRNCDRRLCPEKTFKWPREKVKELGVWFSSTDHELIISMNYKEKLVFWDAGNSEDL